MAVKRLGLGGGIACSCALLLFGLMFLHWFGVKAVNTSKLLFAIASKESGKNAWEALDYIPSILMCTIIATGTVSVLRVSGHAERYRRCGDGLVGVLGTVSTLLVVSQIIDPPIFRVEPTITDEGTVQLPIVFALLAAVGIAVGGFLSMWQDARQGDRSLRIGGRSVGRRSRRR